jgi:hypothetical protein
MSTPPRDVPGLAPPLAPAGGQGVSLAELIGSVGPKIQWTRWLILVLAMILSELVWLVPQFLLRASHFPPGFVAEIWTRTFLVDVVMALAALFCFRWIRPAVGALALAAVAYAVVMIPAGLALSAIFAPPSSTFSFSTHELPEAVLGSLLGLFLFFAPLTFIVPRIRPLWLGMGLGAVAGSVLSTQAQILISLAQLGSNVSSGFEIEMTNLGYASGSAVIFAAAFVGGLALVGFRPAESALAPEPAKFTGQAAEVQAAVNYRTLPRLLRGPGIGSIVFGIIGIVVGAATLEDNGVNAILILLGIFLTVEGVWLLVSPSPAGMIVDGFALIALGVWNIFVTISNASSGGPGGFAFLALFQIIWGFKSFARYRKFSSLPLARPDEPGSKWLDAALKSAVSENAGSDVIRFRVKEKKSLHDFRGKLLDDFGLFFDMNQRLIIVASRDASRITLMGTPAPGGTNPAGFNFAGRTWEGQIDMQNWERFNQWKTAAK